MPNPTYVPFAMVLPMDVIHDDVKNKNGVRDSVGTLYKESMQRLVFRYEEIRRYLR